MVLKLVVCLFFLQFLLVLSFLDDHIVEIQPGKIIGKRSDGLVSFLGIPFAEPPIGKRRFRPTTRKKSWRPRLLNATEYSHDCLQSSLYSSHTDIKLMDEDCLYLNVWQPTREPNSTTLFPVMVWIYGGAFVHGSANKQEYEGNRLAKRGVVMVSFNYRLGALGFLVSTADGLFGNYGLDDQKIALQWVQDNIRCFGGDPDRVTLFGESAGAMSIAHLLLDQHYLLQRTEQRGRPPLLARKLFHGAIMQSNPLGYKYRSVAVANFIGSSFKAQLDCEDLRCLQSESAEELIHVQDTLVAVPRSIGDFFTWGPVLTDQAYFREVRLRPGPVANITVRQPLEALKSIHRLDIPVLLGTNAHEGTVFVFTAYPSRMPRFVFQALVLSFFRASATKVLKMYSPLLDRMERHSNPDFRLVLARIIGDYLFQCPSQQLAEELSHAAAAKVFLYEFRLRTRTPGFDCCEGLSCHTCELPYVFNQMGVVASQYHFPAAAEPRTSSNSVEHHTGSTSEDGGANEVNAEDKQVSFSVSHLLRQVPQWLTMGWLGASETTAQTVPNASPLRLTGAMGVDQAVSDMMADFWTTFARYGDPNGLFTSPNGYAAGTRPGTSSSSQSGIYAAPWWPRVLGELPFNSSDEELRQFSPGTQRGESSRHSDKSNENDAQIEGAAADEEQLEPYAHLFDLQKGSAPFRGDAPLDSPQVLDRSQGSSPLSNKRRQQLVVEPHPGGDSTMVRSHRVPRLHQLVFDGESSPELLPVDCLCAAWNKLRYQF